MIGDRYGSSYSECIHHRQEGTYEKKELGSILTIQSRLGGRRRQRLQSAALGLRRWLLCALSDGGRGGGLCPESFLVLPSTLWLLPVKRATNGGLAGSLSLSILARSNRRTSKKGCLYSAFFSFFEFDFICNQQTLSK